FKDQSKFVGNDQREPIAWLIKNNITEGYTCTAKGKPDKACTQAGDKVYIPGNNVTRGQMALFVRRLANGLGVALPGME
ncbi:MAG: S-layer homology domain-containing protein, partial [Bifidobacteriaceae bacterium]|nr:S-layer homology domain-containing protein [Bifidobacteriaceae bacterium]